MRSETEKQAVYELILHLALGLYRCIAINIVVLCRLQILSKYDLDSRSLLRFLDDRVGTRLDQDIWMLTPFREHRII